jgi:hypothetical protein
MEPILHKGKDLFMLILADWQTVNYNTLWSVPVAQLDRALASGAKGRGFESRQARHFFFNDNQF